MVSNFYSNRKEEWEKDFVNLKQISKLSFLTRLHFPI